MFLYDFPIYPSTFFPSTFYTSTTLRTYSAISVSLYVFGVTISFATVFSAAMFLLSEGSSDEGTVAYGIFPDPVSSTDVPPGPLWFGILVREGPHF